MTWLRAIDARSLRHLDRVEIDLAPAAGAERMHLVLVGPNGCGKSSLLDGVRREIDAAIDGRPHPAAVAEENAADPEMREREIRMAHVGRPVRLRWSDEAAVPDAWRRGAAIFAHPSAPRGMAFASPTKPTPTDTDPKRPDAQIAERLLQVFLNRETEAEHARRSGDELRARVHDAWMLAVQSALRRLLHQPALRLVGDRGAFSLDLPDGRRMAFGELSRGHASAVALFAEVMMRVEAARLRANDPQLQPSGVVIVDAVEADLDARLQRELLPALAQLFPRVQLVVATHSPLVAMSLDHAVVYDLERRRGRPSLDVRRGGLEALVVSMLGLEEQAMAPPPKSAPPARPRPKTSAPPPPPRPKTSAPPPPPAAHRVPPSVPPPARLPPRPRNTLPGREAAPKPDDLPGERTRKTTLGGPGPWSDD